MEPLDDRARAVLLEYRAQLGPSATDSRANWAAIHRRIEHLAEPAVAEATAGSARRWGWTLGAASVAAGLVAALGARPQSPEPLAVGGFAELASTSIAAGRAPTPKRPPRLQYAATIEPRPVTETPRVRQRVRVGEAPIEAETPDTAPPSDLHEQIALLAACRRAARADRHAEALELSQTYSRRFADGAFEEEVAMLGLNALCHLGAVERWNEARAAFERRFSGSPLHKHILRRCPP